MRELLSIGKLWELSQHSRRTEDADAYDLVIVDAPAAGHGAGLLRTPRTFANIARVGPIAHLAGSIAATIADRDFTGIVAVATAEEMPVNETLWLRDALIDEGLQIEATIVNSCYPDRFSGEDQGTLEAARRTCASPLAGAAIAAALSERTRTEIQHEQTERLREGLGHEVVELPYLFAQAIGTPEIEHLADALESGLTRLESLAVSG